MKRIQMAMAAVAILAASGLTTMASAGLYDTWSYKAQIQFSGYNKAETLTNFPALVVLSNNCFSGFAYSQFKSGSNDLAFTADAAGTTNLNYQIETWNPSGLSYVWVQVPALTSNSTITAWWSGSVPTAPACTTNGSTWTNGFAAVYHLNEVAAPRHDSAGYDSILTSYGTAAVTFTNAGVVGGAAAFPTSNNYLGTPEQAELDGMTQLTLEGWAYTLVSDTTARAIISKRTSGSSAYCYALTLGITTAGSLSLDVNNNSGGRHTFNVGFPAGRWVHVTAVFDGVSKQIWMYMNGVSVGAPQSDASTSIASASSALQLGELGGNAATDWNGMLDEVRISNLARSSNWVWATYLNTASNGVFNTYGAAGQNNLNLPSISDGVSQNLSNTSADVTGTLITNGASAATVYLFCATNDCTTNLANWVANSAATTNIGSFTSGVVFTNTLSGLTPNTVYFWNLMASNTTGEAWGAAAGSPHFKTMGPPGVNNNGGAGSIGPYSATLRGTLTNGVSASATVYCGTDTNNWTYTNVLGTVTEVQGIFSTNLTGLARNTTYYYAVLVSNQYGTAQSPATNFTTLPYVWITASTTLLESQTNLESGLPVVVDGAGVVLTLSNSATYGNLPIYQFGNLIVTNGASVVGLSQGSMSPYTITNRGVAIQSAGDVLIAGGSSINADFTGFASGNGPGGGTAVWWGGTHGGRGDSNTNATYGSYTNPTTLGSGGGGGSGLYGGGAIKLIVASNLVVNGILSANGTNTHAYWCGSGSGGSIWITGGCTLGGTGEVQTSGASASYTTAGTSGGGGGRIAMDDTVTYNFHGNIRGSLGSQASLYGSAGTVYFPAAASANFTVYSNQTVVVGNDVTNVFGNLTVYGTLIPGGYGAGMGTGVVIQAANITVASGGAISEDGWGFGAAVGPAPGSGAWNGTNGACHGGWGSFPLGNPYGSATQPTSMGSGGGNGGGGAVKLVVSGILTVNGTISANGLNYTIGGAGGSIWINCGALAGTSTITANAYNTGTYGSGGGRIAIYYKSSTFAGLPAPGLYTNKESISSKVTVKGGYNIGSDGPEDGSIYIVHVVPMGTTVFFH